MTCSGSGIHAPRLLPPASATGTTVRNGFVSGMGSDGISLQLFSRVHGVLVEHNADDGMVLGDDSLVSDSRIVLNGGDGIVGDASVSFRDSRIARVDGATATEATDAGGNTSELRCDESRAPRRLQTQVRSRSAASAGEARSVRVSGAIACREDLWDYRTRAHSSSTPPNMDSIRFRTSSQLTTGPHPSTSSRTGRSAKPGIESRFESVRTIPL